MILTLVIAAFLVVMVLAWKFQPKQEYPTEGWESADDAAVDLAELERAEREVRGWGVAAKPDDERPEEDWGPGTSHKGER
jgi:hypothetical protein